MLMLCCTWLHAPPFRCAIPSRPPSGVCCCNLPMATSVRIAIVGDVHDDWSLEEDTKALQLLKPDLVLFTGRCSVSPLLCRDFGNENVDLVGSISNLDFAKAIILGNHDAWNTEKFSASQPHHNIPLMPLGLHQHYWMHRTHIAAERRNTSGLNHNLSCHPFGPECSTTGATLAHTTCES
ncbi:hypothetical protein Pfo_031061 [Paulownia fortunei]|nr:hypothetical protein Pfo_031061 [Paulownia fortunei]